MRAGTFSSSQVYKLVKSGRGSEVFSAPGLTYIRETRFERLLGRALDNESNARPTSWGNLLELYVWENKIGLNGYEFEHKLRYVHEENEHWTGCPDLVGPEKVGDIKCPYTLKSFCDTMECFGDIEALKENKPEYYWQLVSNSILTGRGVAELIVYVPYKDDLVNIKGFMDTDVFWQYGLDQNKFAFLNWANDEDLPWLHKGGHYKDFNSFEFVVPEDDKAYLAERIKLAVELLNDAT